MQSIARAARFALLSWVAITMAACAGQKEPAQKLLADIEATVTAAAPEAAKYVPDQLMSVQTKFGALKTSFDKHDYAAVVSGAPAVLGAAQMLATAAAAKKDEVLKALNDKWSVLAATVPDSMTAIQNRIDALRKKSGKKIAAGVSLDAARTNLDEAASLWSKAQAAFAGGNMDEAVRTAEDVRTRIEAVAATLKLDPLQR
jgi:prophage DNA circulation protein